MVVGGAKIISFKSASPLKMLSVFAWILFLCIYFSIYLFYLIIVFYSFMCLSIVFIYFILLEPTVFSIFPKTFGMML